MRKKRDRKGENSRLRVRELSILNDLTRLACDIWGITCADALKEVNPRGDAILDARCAVCYVLRFTTRLTNTDISDAFGRKSKAWAQEQILRARRLRHLDMQIFEHRIERLFDEATRLTERTARPDKRLILPAWGGATGLHGMFRDGRGREILPRVDIPGQAAPVMLEDPPCNNIEEHLATQSKGDPPEMYRIRQMVAEGDRRFRQRLKDIQAGLC